ncbi:MAG: hypothetical protein JO345_20000 [Streptosporangiaceae bacterium]|nr:hypothetical protein [Streptosporangiaceae bacterium]
MVASRAPIALPELSGQQRVPRPQALHGLPAGARVRQPEGVEEGRGGGRQYRRRRFGETGSRAARQVGAVVGREDLPVA